ncbi:hypothetical protein [Burkholderia sp. JP2-270]|uniref:hypothetical protein n=1 Tax=Burkholderia sp. JP2-270 TaxID=2217913 RepID=UPI0013A6B08C|nr:hypothetical protein [Burkholderia sp. JP2-270]
MMHLLYGGTEASWRHGRRVSRPLRRHWLGGYDELAIFGQNQTLLLATLLARHRMERVAVLHTPLNRHDAAALPSTLDRRSQQCRRLLERDNLAAPCSDPLLSQPDSATDRAIAIATGTIPQDLRITHSLWIARGDYQTM